MTVIAGRRRRVGVDGRQLVQLPADQVVAGDAVRDLGRSRRVVGTEPSVTQLSLVWLFDPAEDLTDRLRVSSLVAVSVWQVCGGD